MPKSIYLNEALKIHIDGLCIEGDLKIPSSPLGIVIFAHGSGSSRFSPRNNFVAKQLQENGIGTLLIDLLTPLEDQNFSKRFDIPLLAERLLTAVAWLRSNEKTATYPIGLFGASRGAAAALQVAASLSSPEKEGIRAIVSRGGRPDLAGIEVLKRINAPTLLIVGGNDSVVIDLNEQAFSQMECHKRLEIVPGATHLFEEPGALERVTELAISWFIQHLTQHLE